jgi:tetratricopeptide (TPR) repeat protein
MLEDFYKDMLEPVVARIRDWLYFGNRVIFAIALFLLSVLYWIVHQFFEPHDFPTTVTSPFFYGPAVVIIIASILIYLFRSTQQPPADHLVIHVANFYPVTKEAEDEAKNMRFLIIRELRKLMEENGIKGEVDAAWETINPLSKDTKQQASLLRMHKRAHILIYGEVMVENKKCNFRPTIHHGVKHSYRFSPPETIMGEEIVVEPEGEGLSFREYGLPEILNFTIFVCGIGRINEFYYKDAIELFKVINNPFPEVNFYLGFAQLNEGQLAEALKSFCRATDEKRDYYDAWVYRFITLLKLERFEDAVYPGTVAKLLAEEKPQETKDLYVSLWAIIERLSEQHKQLENLIKEVDKYVYVRIITDKFINRDIKEKIMNAETSRDIDAFIFRVKGDMQLIKNNYASAIDSYDQALDLVPNLTDALLGKGLAFAKLGKETDAHECLELVLEKLEGDDIVDTVEPPPKEKAKAKALLFLKIARTYALLGDNQYALQHLRDAMQYYDEARSWAATEDDFETLREEEGYNELAYGN